MHVHYSHYLARPYSSHNASNKPISSNPISITYLSYHFSHHSNHWTHKSHFPSPFPITLNGSHHTHIPITTISLSKPSHPPPPPFLSLPSTTHPTTHNPHLHSHANVHHTTSISNHGSKSRYRSLTRRVPRRIGLGVSAWYGWYVK